LRNYESLATTPTGTDNCPFSR